MAKEAIWLKKFHFDLGVMRMEQVPIILFCDYSGAVAQSKDPRNHKKGKHIKRKYHIIRDIVPRGDVVLAKIDSVNNLAACEVEKEAIWLKKFHFDLGVMRMEQVPIILFCDYSGVVAQSKDPRNQKKGKHIKRKYHIIRDIVPRGDVVLAKIDSVNNLADPFTKALPQRTFESHLEGMRVRLVHNSL